MFTSGWVISPPSLAFKVQTSKFYQERNPKAEKMKYPRAHSMHVLEDGNNLVQTRLGGEG